MQLIPRIVPLLLLLCRQVDGDEKSGSKYYNEFTVCENSKVVVDEISILCDSPGTYYYGSGKYRNSAKCQAGDKARLKVEFYVAEELQQRAFLYLHVHGYGTVQDVNVYQNEDICGISAVSSLYGMEACNVDGVHLGAGYYVLEKTFYWGTQSDSYEYSFVPKVIIGISSDPSKGQFDLGGANTQYCAGNSFMKWTTGVGQSASNTVKSFFITFGILMGVILGIFLAGMAVVRAASAPPPSSTRYKLEIDDVERNEQYKIKMLGKNQDLVSY